MRHLVLCALVLAACGEAPPPEKTALEQIDDARDDAAPTKREIPEKPPLEQINAARDGKALAEDEILEKTALAHAEEMARLGYFGHFSPTPANRTPDVRLALHGWPLERAHYEMLAMNTTLQEAIEMWVAKPALKKALSDPKYKVVGVASATSAAGLESKRTYWVLLLGE